MIVKKVVINEKVMSDRFLNALEGVSGEYRGVVTEIIIVNSFLVCGASLTRTLEEIKSVVGVGPWVSLRDINVLLFDFLVWLYEDNKPHYLYLVDPVKLCDYLGKERYSSILTGRDVKSALLH